MKSVAEHLEECLAVAKPLPPFTVALSDAVGCVLAEDVRSLVDVPQGNLAARDGYAVRIADVAGASRDTPVELPVVEEVRADTVDPSSLVAGATVRISSGATLPTDTEAVIPIEDTDQGRAKVKIFAGAEAGENVRAQAEDFAAGEVLLRAGVRIGSRQIAVLASAGHSTVLVHPAPRVVIMSIGDEIQEPGMPAAVGKIYDANSHALASAVRDAGGQVFRVGAVSDDKRELREMLEDQLVRADIIITTGGLSYGGGDTLKEVLSPLGTVRFDNVAMAPGRQLGVGKIEEDTTVFCLPGSPVAAMTAFEVFIRPALRHMAGYSTIHRRSITAAVQNKWESPADTREFVRGRVVGNPHEGYRVEALGDPGRPLLKALAEANCLAVVPEQQRAVQVGDTLECIVLNA
ncbi:molybdopterin molybdotransferase MoeA [Trueperella bialowiezensis]|uniref:Molybdopterin molybdenumtransferase n=1 Tax=Trueperella bialowiezensis TaxID=312285 RepID=A0A448PDS1_9ACTO|nr:gephyrin-like molybdotransferase Glp [Trueperella bialowiezensis]VEI13078.1 Molybdopterin molybdenumtransferase [Trueperella bialowiezensis]